MSIGRALEKQERDFAEVATIFAPTGWKTLLLQSIASLPFGTTLLITVKYGTKDERGWTETQTQSQGVHEKRSSTAISDAINKTEKITLRMSYILHPNTTWNIYQIGFFDLFYLGWKCIPHLLLLWGKLTQIIWRQCHKNQLGHEK